MDLASGCETEEASRILPVLMQSRLVCFKPQSELVFETPPPDVVSTINQWFQREETARAGDSDSGESVFVTQSVTRYDSDVTGPGTVGETGTDDETREELDEAAELDDTRRSGRKRKHKTRYVKHQKDYFPFLLKSIRKSQLPTNKHRVLVNSEIEGFFRLMRRTQECPVYTESTLTSPESDSEIGEDFDDDDDDEHEVTRVRGKTFYVPGSGRKDLQVWMSKDFLKKRLQNLPSDERCKEQFQTLAERSDTEASDWGSDVCLVESDGNSVIERFPSPSSPPETDSFGSQDLFTPASHTRSRELSGEEDGDDVTLVVDAQSRSFYASGRLRGDETLHRKNNEPCGKTSQGQTELEETEDCRSEDADHFQQWDLTLENPTKKLQSQQDVSSSEKVPLEQVRSSDVLMDCSSPCVTTHLLKKKKTKKKKRMESVSAEEVTVQPHTANRDTTVKHLERKSEHDVKYSKQKKKNPNETSLDTDFTPEKPKKKKKKQRDVSSSEKVQLEQVRSSDVITECSSLCVTTALVKKKKKRMDLVSSVSQYDDVSGSVMAVEDQTTRPDVGEQLLNGDAAAKHLERKSEHNVNHSTRKKKSPNETSLDTDFTPEKNKKRKNVSSSEKVQLEQVGNPDVITECSSPRVTTHLLNKKRKRMEPVSAEEDTVQSHTAHRDTTAQHLERKNEHDIKYSKRKKKKPSETSFCPPEESAEDSQPENVADATDFTSEKPKKKKKKQQDVSSSEKVQLEQVGSSDVITQCSSPHVTTALVKKKKQQQRDVSSSEKVQLKQVGSSDVITQCSSPRVTTALVKKKKKKRRIELVSSASQFDDVETVTPVTNLSRANVKKRHKLYNLNCELFDLEASHVENWSTASRKTCREDNLLTPNPEASRSSSPSITVLTSAKKRKKKPSGSVEGSVPHALSGQSTPRPKDLNEDNGKEQKQRESTACDVTEPNLKKKMGCQEEHDSGVESLPSARKSDAKAKKRAKRNVEEPPSHQQSRCRKSGKSQPDANTMQGKS